MKTNILNSYWIGLDKVMSRTFFRLDSLSILFRQSVLAIFVACLTVLGVGNAWGKNGDTHDYSQSLSALLNNNASISSINIANPGFYVKEVIVSWSYNKSYDPAVTISVTVGSTSFGSKGVGTSTSSTTSFTTSPQSSVSGAISISFTNETGSGTGHGTFYVTNVCLVEGIDPAADPYKVTFNAQGGSCATSSLTEASAGAGVTLPVASPSAACASEGWTFFGWATAQCASSTTTAPDIVGKAGDTYYPSGDITLHAVYYQLTGGTSTAEFDASTLTGLTKLSSDTKRPAQYIHTASKIELYIKDYGVWSSTWDIDNTVNNGNGWGYIKSPSKIQSVAITVSSGYAVDHISESDAGSAALSTSGTSQTITCTGQVNTIYLYAANDAESRMTTFTVTYSTANYYSNPSCCEYEVSVSESGSSHLAAVDGMTFSSSSVATCGDAASRTITITVTPASGYTLFGDTKPVFTKTSGTVAATIGSVTDNGNGTFSYECTFASNNDGAGTFAISPGQFTNYRTLCCTKYDITLASSGSKTGGSFEVDPAKACEGTEITLMATPDDGYEFSAWTITNDDDDDDDVTTTVLGSGNEDEDAIEFDMPAYNITVDAAFACTEPSISAQPSGASYTQGDAATALSVTASAGTGTVDYQWQSSSDNSSWDDIDDEDGSTFTPPTSSTGTMYYRVVVTNHECSESLESDVATVVVSAPSVCKTPTFSVSAGTYSSAQSVELSCGTDGATIRYTTNGDDPTESSSAYSSAISVSVNTTIKAKAFKGGMTPSSVASATYNIRCAAPTFSLDEDIYVGSQSLTMSSATTGATVRYTTDESEPTGSSTAYSSALTVSTSTTYKAKAYKDGMTESEESEVYVMIQCATPTFSVSAGTYNANQSVSISTTYGTTIYYTLDGSTPDTKSSVYSSAITIDATKTLKAIAVKSGCEDSDVASATYTLKCATPTFSPVAGTYTGAQSVSMSCATTGSAIHYTTNGIDPTGSSTTYSSAISVGTNQTVKAIATKTGWSDSEVASAAYTIKYNVAVASVDNVTISATTPSVAEGSSAAAAYGSTVSLSYSGVASGKTWGGWNVYKTGDASTTVTVTSNQFTMPAYNVTVSAIIYGDAIAWCDPDVEVTGDVHLTSTKDVYVHLPSTGLININSDDMGSATKMEVGYLDENEDEVDKAESPFRLYNSTAASIIDEEDLDYGWDVNYSLRYTPTDYNQMHNYKLQLTFKRGDKVLKTMTHDINGRSLPEEFVIAVKNTNDSKWYALPSNLAATKAAQGVISVSPALEIEVDNTTTPTKATIAPTTRIYKALGRATATNNMYGIRFTTTGSNKMQAASDVTYVWLPTANADNSQVWQLASSDLQSYTVTMPTIGSKKLGIFANSGDKIGYAATPHSYGVYFLPVESKIDELAATVEEWSQYAVQVEANASSISATKVLGVLGATTSDKETLPTPLAANTYLLKLDGDLDYTEKNGQTLQFKWYDSSDKLKAYSWITVPSIIAAGANTSWSAFETAIGKSTTLDDIVLLTKPMTVDKVAKSDRVVIDKSSTNTGSLDIAAGKELIVAKTVKKYNGSSFGATTASDLYIGSNAANGNGALVAGNASDNTAAGVAFYTKARKESGWVNQFIGVPLASMTAYDGFYGMYVYGYDDVNDAWKVVSNNGAMYPFTAYNLLRKEGTAGTLYMAGTLNLPGTSGTKELSMGSRVGDYLFANSWTAPIDVASIETTDFSSAEATIYIFNAGTKSDYDAHKSEYGDNPGQWISLPVATVAASPGSFPLTVIPSMEAFMVKSTAASASLTLDYKKHVYDPAVGGTATVVPNRAPRRQAADELTRIRLYITGESGPADNLLMFEREDFSTGFDNGWEARKVMGSAFAPQMYAMSEDGKMAINCVPNLEGTVIGFKAGTDDENYTFSFDYDEEAEELYLLDIQTGVYTRVTKENSYAFFADDKEEHSRFILTRNAPGVLTGLNEVQSDKDPANGVFKFIENDKMYILYRGVLYDATGKRVSIINR